MIVLYHNGSPLHDAIARWLDGRGHVVHDDAALDEIMRAGTDFTLVIDAVHQRGSGYAMCETLKTWHENPPIIVLISNENAAGLAEKAAYAAVDHLISAPFTPADLEAFL